MGAGTIIIGIALLPVRQIWSALPDLPYDDSQLQVRAGYYTDNGKYRGGIPRIDSEYELFGCTEFIYDYTNGTTSEDTSATAGNATACARWTATEVGSDAYKTDRCSCRSVEISGEDDYCDTWTCSRLEIDHAILLEKEVESTRCTCQAAAEEEEEEEEEVDSSGNFCAAWTCLTTGVHGGRWMEEFQCTRASSLSVEYCDAWTGVVTSADVVSVSTCACLQQLEGVGVCLYWECERRGMEKCFRGGPGWCNFGVSIGVGGLFGSFGALLAAWAIFRLLHRARHPSHQGMYVCFVLLGFFWMAVWSIGVVIWGGQDGALYAGIWWGALILIDLLYACCTNCS